MDKTTLIHFELMVMDIADNEHCKTALAYAVVSEQLHQAVEDAIMDMCMDAGIDYDPVYY